MGQFNEDIYVNGTFKANFIQLTANAVGNTQFNASDPLSVTKQEHLHTRILAQVNGTAATAERRIVHQAFNAGTILGVQACAIVPCTGTSVVNIDVKKNGVTVLSSTLSLNSTPVAYQQVTGTLSVTTFVAGDVLDITITPVAGTGAVGQGVSVALKLAETY